MQAQRVRPRYLPCMEISSSKAARCPLLCSSRPLSGNNRAYLLAAARKFEYIDIIKFLYKVNAERNAKNATVEPYAPQGNNSFAFCLYTVDHCFRTKTFSFIFEYEYYQ